MYYSFCKKVLEKWKQDKSDVVKRMTKKKILIRRSNPGMRSHRPGWLAAGDEAATCPEHCALFSAAWTTPRCGRWSPHWHRVDPTGTEWKDTCKKGPIIFTLASDWSTPFRETENAPVNYARFRRVDLPGIAWKCTFKETYDHHTPVGQTSYRVLHGKAHVKGSCVIATLQLGRSAWLEYCTHVGYL